MGVTVNEAGSDHAALGIDNFFSRLVDPANRSNAAVEDAKVRLVARQSRAVDDSAAANNQIVSHAVLLLSIRHEIGRSLPVQSATIQIGAPQDSACLLE